MAESPPPTLTDPALKGSNACSPSKRLVSVTSRNSWNIAQITGKMPALQEELAMLDRNGDGRIDLDELAAAVEKLAHNRSTIKNLRLTIAVLATVVILIVGANFGLSFATASLSQKLKTGNGNALVDSSTGVTLRTASGSLSAPYTLLDAITTSDNTTTVRYTLPRAVGQAGCQLYSEGHFTVPASIFGPQAVYGNSTRPRTYTILELVGCSSNGNIAQGAALEAMLQATTVEHDAYYIFFTCHPDAANCTAAQFWDASGTSLPTYSGINRRLLSATTSELLTSLAHTSRRSVLSIIVPGAETTQGGDAAGGGGNDQLVTGQSRGLQGAVVFEPCVNKDENGNCVVEQPKNCLVYDENGVCISNDVSGGRRRATEVYQQHLYASPDTRPQDLRFYDCVLCTFLWRKGHLEDDVYSGDIEFGGVLKAYVPWLHHGYLVYGRKLVSLFSLAGEWATANVMAPVTQPWALTMGRLVGRSHGAFTAKVALEGFLCFTAIAPGTLVLGVVQAVSPVLLTDLLGYIMAGWIVLGAVLYRLTSLVGQGWLGLLLPQVTVTAALHYMWQSKKYKHMVSTSKSTVNKH